MGGSQVIYLGLGSNLGNRHHHLEEARRLLQAEGVRILRNSSVIETEPWGVTEQPKFLNQVLEVDGPGNPQELLNTIKKVEAAVGRRPTYRWGPREIDIDILLFDELRIDEPNLKIPHPELWQREFVLGPLSELRPDLTAHPELLK